MLARSIEFPRSVDRGPIEALVAAVLTSPWIDFRDQSIAAPLKRIDCPHARGRVANFRDQSIAAPLKHVNSGGTRDSRNNFRDQSIAAPLKQGRSGLYAQRSGISAISRSRPH